MCVQSTAPKIGLTKGPHFVLVQTDCVRHTWWWTEAKLAIVFTYFFSSSLKKKDGIFLDELDSEHYIKKDGKLFGTPSPPDGKISSFLS